MNRALIALIALSLGGCVLDRTGQSASEVYRRELALQGARVANIDGELAKLDDRVVQLEEMNRARGQDAIMRMETLDQVRTELSRVRGDLELLRHDYDQNRTDGVARTEDAIFRVEWLEARAEALEKSLGLETPAPPAALTAAAQGDLVAPVDGENGATVGVVAPVEGDTADAADAAGAVDDPDAMITLAEDHLSSGREKAAEAVLDRFLTLHPKHERVAEARYRRAEAAFNAKNYAGAVLRFQEVIDNHRKSAWAAWAMLRQGECFEAQGQDDNAKLFFEDVVRMWPKSKAAKEARQKL